MCSMRLACNKSVNLLALIILLGCGKLNDDSARLENSERIGTNEIRELIKQLHDHKWRGSSRVFAVNFYLTEPMKKIIAIGNSTEDDLIYALQEQDNRPIRDQLIILLGGVGSEKAIPHIIAAMISQNDISRTGNGLRINRCANLALTNITVADVIYHHGGGILVVPVNDHKELWKAWWRENKESFKISEITTSRNYTNYPNYGIYRSIRGIRGHSPKVKK